MLSGKYAVRFNEICLPNGDAGGAASDDIIVVNFNTAKGTASLNGINDIGELVGGNGVVTESAVSKSSPYSNTATTITLNGTTLTIMYGPVKKGIAQSFVAGGIDSNQSSCEDTITALHQ